MVVLCQRIRLDIHCRRVGNSLFFYLQPIKLEVDEEKKLLVKFDPFYRNDLNNWVAEEMLSIKYMEHPQVDSLILHGEVHYPNLSFELMEVNFGCILNDTEVIRYITVTNCSPLVVKFHWFFLVDDDENQIRYQQCGENRPVVSLRLCSGFPMSLALAVFREYFQSDDDLLLVKVTESKIMLHPKFPNR